MISQSMLYAQNEPPRDKSIHTISKSSKSLKAKPINPSYTGNSCGSCCPPMDKTLLSELFQFTPLGVDMNGKYQLKWNDNSYFSNLWQKYTDYLKTCEPELKNVTISLELIDAGNSTSPDQTSQTAACTNGANFWATASPGGGGATGNNNMFSCHLEVNHWYRVKAYMYTQPEGVWSERCPKEVNIYFRIQIQNGRRKASITDGTRVIRTTTVTGNNR